MVRNIERLNLLALCRCCVGGPKKSSKGKGTSSSTGFSYPPEATNALKRVEKARKKEQKKLQNHNLFTYGGLGFLGVQAAAATGRRIQFEIIHKSIGINPKVLEIFLKWNDGRGRASGDRILIKNIFGFFDRHHYM
uniref:Uncharacterized protein n=1 Tax=Globodera pallida TaxID=36090 RepID=A0A183BRH2_GLOPA